MINPTDKMTLRSGRELPYIEIPESSEHSQDALYDPLSQDPVSSRAMRAKRRRTLFDQGFIGENKKQKTGLSGIDNGIFRQQELMSDPHQKTTFSSVRSCSEEEVSRFNKFADKAKQRIRRNCVAQGELTSQFQDMFSSGNRMRSGAIDQHPWFGNNNVIGTMSGKFMRTFTNHLTGRIKEAFDTDELSTETDYERVIREVVQASFAARGPGFQLDEPISLFIYDTETNRLNGGIVSIGWIRLDIKDPTDIQVTCKNHLLPPTFVSYGAERVHKMPIEWVKQQHQLGRTVAPEQVANEWLQHVRETGSAIGFNVLYDLNAVNRLFLTLDLDSKQVDTLFAKIGGKNTMDVQDYLLRIDPHTRYKHQLPFSDTVRHREIATDEFEDTYGDGREIEYLPNRKLETYGDAFLGLDTEQAHDALYDCVMTLGGFTLAAGLRKTVLHNEAAFYTKKQDKRLTNYDRVIQPSEQLRRRINEKAPRGEVDHPIYLSATQESLPNNPSLRSTPMIYQPTGVTTHRRHIIPKSQIASVVRSQEQAIPTKQTELLFDTLNNPLFEQMAREHISPRALTICLLAKEIERTNSEEKKAQLYSTIYRFVKEIERVKDKNVSMRYFEREPAKGLIDALPSLDELDSQEQFLENYQTMTENVLKVILYSFYHALEFNQFIGPGAENVLAGKAFHYLSGEEQAVIASIDAATGVDGVDHAVQSWLQALAAALIYNVRAPGEDDIEQTLARLSPLDFSTEPAPTKQITSEQVHYFLEQQAAVHDLLEAFYHFQPPQQMTALTSMADAKAKRDGIVHNVSLINTLFEHAETKTRKTFSERAWLQPLLNSAARLQREDTVDGIQSNMNDMNVVLDTMLQALEASSLYQGDKTHARKLIELLFFEKQLVHDFPDIEMGNDIDQLQARQKQARELVTSLYDSTAYDPPSNSVAAMQNHLLLPLFKSVVGKESLNVQQSKTFLRYLMEADHRISEALGVSREIDVTKPLHSDYLSYLY